MTTTTKIITLALTSLLIGACARNTDPVDTAVEASEDPALQAKDFVGACSLKPIDAVLTGILTGGAAAIKSAATVYRFEGADISRKTYLYTATNCTGEAALVFTESGAFDILADNKTADGGKFIDMDFKRLDVRIESAEGLTVANAISLCGSNAWSLDQDAEVTTKSAEVSCYNAQVPRKVANIYMLDGGSLYLGTPTKDPVGEFARPSALDKTQVYTAR